MDTCTNCGATLRPGAKFCTTCGTRLNDMPAPTQDTNNGWGTPRSASEENSQETMVFSAVPPPIEQDDAPSISESRQSSEHAWSSAYGSGSASTPSSDPASRFISALDRDVQPVDEAEQSEESGSTTESPTPVFTPPPPSNWSYSAGAEHEPVTEDASGEDSTWEAPSTWDTVTSGDEPHVEDAQNDVDTAGSSDDGSDDVDSLSGDESIDLSKAADMSPELAPDEARDKAIALADELRRTIRMMSGGGESDHGAAVMALTEASLYVGDFSDVRGVVADVKNDPRDIHMLGNLAAKVDRIEALLDEHTSLAETIETAIKELNG